MDIRFECQHCSQQIVIEEAGAGRQIDCPRCHSQATVPLSPSKVTLPSLPTEHKVQYRCNNARCNGEWSEHQLLREMFNDKTVLLCPDCRFGVSEITKPISFWSRMPDAFTYPIRGNGVWILASATVVLSVLGLAQPFMRIVGMGILGLLAGVVMFAFIGMLVINIIRTTAYDEEKTMELPDTFSSGDLREAVIQLIGSFLLVFLPAIVCSFLANDRSYYSSWHWLGLGLWALGALYYPMALLAVVMLDSLAGVNPLLVVPAIIRTLRQYLLVVALLTVMCLLYGGVSALSAALPWGLKLISYPVAEGCSLYSLAVSARLLGLLYRSNESRLGWSG